MEGPFIIVGADVDSKTLWASGYEVYDRLSPALAQFLEGLTATHEAKFFHEEAARLGNPLRTTIRGSPLNQGPALEAVHPIIRTNPVTGWKSVYVNRGFTRRINGVTKDESDMLLQYLFNVSCIVQLSACESALLRRTACNAEPRCTSPLQVEQERSRDLGQQIHLAHSNIRLRSCKSG